MEDFLRSQDSLLDLLRTDASTWGFKFERLGRSIVFETPHEWKDQMPHLTGSGRYGSR